MKLACLMAAATCLIVSPLAAKALHYPDTRRDAIVEDHFGRSIADPYRWLEADARRDPPVAEWVALQNSLARGYLDKLEGRDQVRRVLTRTWNLEKLSPPRERGDRQFFEQNSGLQNQNVIVVRERGVDRVLVDPNASSASGELVVRDWKPSPSGDRLLYAAQAHGGDRRRLHIVDVATGKDEELPINGVRTPAFDWAADGSGIFYTAYPAAGEDNGAPTTSAIYFHRLGSAQADDARLFEDPTGGKLILWPRPADDSRWLAIEAGTTDGSRANVFVLDLREAGKTPRPLVSGMRARWSFIGGRSGKLYFLTTDSAPLGRVVSLDPQAGDGQKPILIGSSPGGAVEQAVLVRDEVVIRSLDGLRSRLHRYSLSGQDRGAIALPPLTVVSAVTGRAGRPSLYYTLSSMVMAPTLYRYDLETGKSSVLLKPRAGWNPAKFTVRQITARSDDGTRVPVTLAYRTIAGRAPRPTILMVYGGWGLSVDLAFYESRLAWMEMGGVFAIAHIRGGGEFGEAWHKAAIKEGHLRGIDDFVAAAKTLQAQGITTPEKTIAYGSSNGGMMTAATVNKRPDLFAAAIPRVPVTDLLRFPAFTSGKTWIGELGDPADPKDFPGLMFWSPLHNIKPGRRYPSILVNTSLGDDRVVPMHSFKYVATLQASDLGARPKLLRVEQDAGHGEGKSTGQLIDEFTDLWTFAAHETGLIVH